MTDSELAKLRERLADLEGIDKACDAANEHVIKLQEDLEARDETVRKLRESLEEVVRECCRHALFLQYEADHGGAREYLIARKEEAMFIEGKARALLAEGDAHARQDG